MLKRTLGTIASCALFVSLSATAFADDAMSMPGAAMASPTPMASMAPAMHTDPMVGGAAMYPEKNIVENAVNSKDHTTLVAAVKAADLVSTLEGPGPFTVFAPTNDAFDGLPAGTVDTLLKPENKAKLVGILTYHVVPGTLDVEALKAKIKAGHGKAKLTTVNGEILTVTFKSGVINITDAHKDVAQVTTADVYQSNGVIQVINKVLLP